MVVATSFSCAKKGPQVDASGTFEATEVLVSAQTSGILQSFQVETGQLVQANKTLGLVDTLQLFLKKQQLEASLLALKSRFPDKALQMAALNQQLKTAKKELVRLQHLLKENAIPEKSVDDLHAQILLLNEQIASGNKTLDQTTKSLQHEVRALEMQIEQVQDMISRSYLTSPIDGRILVSYAQAGELVAPGKVLFKVADLNKLKLKVYLTADQLPRIKLGDTVDLLAEFGAKEDKAYTGTIISIADKAEFTPKTVQTKDERANLVYAVQVSVVNDGRLKMGMYGGIVLK